MSIREPAEGAGRATRRAGLAISAISLAAVVWWALGQEQPRLPSGGAELGALAAAVGLYAIATLVRGERWRLLLAREGASLSRTDAGALTAVGYMGNNVLPARGGDAIRAYLGARRAGTGIRDVVGTLIAERLLDALTLLTLYVVLAYGILRGIDAPDGGRAALIAGGAVALAAAAGLAAYSARRRPAVRRALDFAAPMASASRGLRGRHGGTMLGLTALVWMLEAGTYLAAAAAVGLGMDALEALYVVALASVFVLIPSSPGYVGTLDAAILFGARAVGADGGEALSYLIAVRFVLIVPITLAGAALLVARYGGWQALRGPRARARRA